MTVPSLNKVKRHLLRPSRILSRPLLAGCFAGLTTLLTTCLSGTALYLGAMQALKSEVRANLIRTATVAAANVDGDAHRTFTSPRQETTPAYFRALGPLDRVQKASGDIKYIYTCVLRHGQVFFVLDPTLPGDRNGDGVDDKSHVMQPYPEAAPAMLAALRTGTAQADQEPSQDQWAKTISGYAPIRDSRRNLVGIVGVDLLADRYAARLAAIRRAAMVGIGVTGALALVTGIGVFWGSQRGERAARLLRLAHEKLEERVAERTTDLAEANRQLEIAYSATIKGWSRVLDLRDEETQGHSERVTEMTLRLAAFLGMDGDALIHIERGALLHDIGKMAIPDSILRKPGPLTDDEWEIMRRHPAQAHAMLFPIVFLRPALDIPYCHHEKWDGTGYPRGLAGRNIPLAARLFAAVDIWDALSSDRPYRKAWPRDRVADHLYSLSGSHLDPEVVRALLPLITATEEQPARLAQAA